jgi:hypothetical protein
VLLRYTENIQEKHLGGKRKKNKKIRKTKLSESYKRSCPSIKSYKEKGLKLRQRPVIVLKTSVISFSPKTPQEARRQLLPHSNTLGLPLVHQQANKSGTLLGITQDSPKRLKDIL